MIEHVFLQADIKIPPNVTLAGAEVQNTEKSWISAFGGMTFQGGEDLSVVVKLSDFELEGNDEMLRRMDPLGMTG